MKKNYEYDGVCPICRCRIFGSVHNCPGEIQPNPRAVYQNVQLMEDIDAVKEEKETFNERLEYGFSLMGFPSDN